MHLFVKKKSKCGFDCLGVSFKFASINSRILILSFFSTQGCLFNNIFVKNLPSFFTRIEHACRIKCVNKNPFNIYLHVHVVT